MLHLAVSRDSSIAVPPEVQETLAGSYLLTTGINMVLSGSLIRLLRILENKGISVISLKGPVAAQTLYGKIGSRQFGDLDLLVRRRDASSAIRILENIGYIPQLPLSPRKIPILIRNRIELTVAASSVPTVDLHWAAVEPYFAWSDEDQLWRRSIMEDMEGFPVRTLGLVDSAIYYCIKAGQDGWETGYQLMDACKALQRLSANEWTEVVDLAVRADKWRILAITFLLIEPLAPGLIPHWAMEEARATRRALRIASASAQRLCGRRALPKRFTTHVYQKLICLEHLQDKARLLGRLLFEAGEKDLAILPDWLCFWPVIQIVRLARSFKNTAFDTFLAR